MKGPYKVISAHSDAVYAMVTTDAFCISGTTGLIAVSSVGISILLSNQYKRDPSLYEDCTMFPYIVGVAIVCCV